MPTRACGSAMALWLLLAGEPVGANSPTVAFPSDGATYSPRSFETSTLAANASAAFLVAKPRLSVCRGQGCGSGLGKALYRLSFDTC